MPLDHAAILQGLARNDPACESCTSFVRTDLNTTGLRPSIETTVHALMPQRVVVHVHCVNTIAWAIRADAEAAPCREASRLSTGPSSPMPAPACRWPKPFQRGLHRASMYWCSAIMASSVAADSVEEADALLDRVVAAVHASRARRCRNRTARALAKRCAGTHYQPAVMDETHALATDPLALKRGQSLVFYPDHVVFLGVGVATAFEDNPPLVAIPGEGVFIRNDAKPAIEPMGRCLADVMRRVEDADPLVALTDGDIDRLVNWDAEKYRQTLKA